MAYFRPSIDAEGIHIPTYDDILEHLMDEYKAVFGEDVYLGEDSKDYQMLSVLARALDDFAALAVDAYNSRSPLYATGDSLDVLCTLVGITRASAEHAVATVTLSGLSGTVIEAGKKVVDENGDLWSLDEDVTLGDEDVTTTVTKDDAGSCQMTEGFISMIYDPVSGWTGVENVTVGTVGKDVETDEELRTRMRRALVAGATYNESAMESALWKIDGISKVMVCVNNSNATDERGIPAHSICVLATGGDEQEIAETIFHEKAPGIGTYGNVNKTVVDHYGAENTVSFSRVVEVPLTISITGTVYDTRVDLDALSQTIKEAVMDHVNGMDVGESLTINRLYAVIYAAAGLSSMAVGSLSVTGSGSAINGTYPAEWNETLIVSSLDNVVTNIDYPE